MGTATRLRHEAWWLLTGTIGMLLAALIGPHLAAPDALDVRWSGVLGIAILGGFTTAIVGPWLLPLAQHAGSSRQSRAGSLSATGDQDRGWARQLVARRQRLRPLTQGAAVGCVAAAVTAVGVSIFPHVLAPVELRVGHGLPRLLLSQLQWAVPTAGVAGATLGLAGWAAVAERDAIVAFRRLVGGAGPGTYLAWAAAAANVAASVLTVAVLSEGSAGAGPVGMRAAAVVRAGAWWSFGWATWGVASLGLLAVLVLLAERAHPQWRPVAIAAVGVAVAADIVAVALLAAALPALAASAAAGQPAAFVAVERTALGLSAVGGNGVYGIVGLALVRAAGPRLHPLVRLFGLGAFLAALGSGVLLLAAPDGLALVVGTSIGLFVAFSLGFGWQLAVSRRTEPALEMLVRRAVRTLVPLHPLPLVARVRHAMVVDIAVHHDRLAALLPSGLEPRVQNGRTIVSILGGVTEAARPSGLPACLGLTPTPTIVLSVPVRGDGVNGSEEQVTFLRGWADGTLTAAATHWLTEFQLSRVQLELRSGLGRWIARGSAGSVQLELEEDPNAQAASGGRGLLQAVVARGGRLAEISL
ncbi:MAG: DUF2071 domain-containing protein, partial [Actinomycetota bacterium]|nr:DUF2071 domain-containing protein [Actinomycetota bacterium]